MNDIHLGEMINYYRKQNGWTMKQLGEKMGKTESAISLWISNKRSPMVDDLDKLSKLFGVSPETLMFGDTNTSIIDKTVKTLQKLEVPRQEKVLEFAETHLKEQKEEEKRAAKIVPFKKKRLSDEELWDVVEHGVANDGTEQTDYEKQFFFNLLREHLDNDDEYED
ncbi:phage repressor [Lactococcus lactis subsp. lactis Dephy 1]|uniref:helix-turn-helix domain-containing protein n=1 Tax=Lactococcus lactis TaxID=1358 RepID=UPI0003B7F80F|nr:helix-turn-helix transcriptional regulator [Lactococcus lactis]CDI47112.1 phage repressor [Lactococcus lactis subsp. lactis Dephy 1]